MNNIQLTILIVIALINLTAFIIMIVDKLRSTKPGSSRISEGMLFFMATIFGAIGVYAGMFAVRHKTRKWYFLLGIPLLIIQNLATAYVIYLLIQNSSF